MFFYWITLIHKHIENKFFLLVFIPVSFRKWSILLFLCELNLKINWFYIHMPGGKLLSISKTWGCNFIICVKTLLKLDVFIFFLLCTPRWQWELLRDLFHVILRVLHNLAKDFLTKETSAPPFCQNLPSGNSPFIELRFALSAIWRQWLFSPLGGEILSLVLGLSSY